MQRLHPNIINLEVSAHSSSVTQCLSRHRSQQIVMPSFQPGTRVLARLVTKKHIWRPAKVVQPDSDQDPDTVTVSYVGKTGKVNLPSKHVKLAPDIPGHVPTIDLIDDIDHHKPNTSIQPNNTNNLPSFSDPWDTNSQARSTTVPAEPINQPTPIRSFSDPRSITPHVQPANPLNPQHSAAETAKQSSRHWLLAEHSAETDCNPPTTPSELQFSPPQRHPPVVRDPSFPASQHPAQARGILEPPGWDALHELSPREETVFHSQREREENFVRFSEKTHPQSFQFTPIRSDASTSSHTLAPHAPTSPLPQGQMSLRPAISRAFSTDVHRPTSAAWTTAINSLPHPARSQDSSKPVPSTPLRNRLTTRDNERHPWRTIDEHIRIPRTTVGHKDMTRVPRHPQSSFDDDVPIPRNIIPPRYPSNVVAPDGSDMDFATRSYPASKRQRLRYDMLAYDQMPPSLETGPSFRQLSRRLAKREKENRMMQKENNWEYTSPSLTYQRPLPQENGIVRIAPGFDSTTNLFGSFQAMSGKEANVLEDIFAGLSVNANHVLDIEDPLPLSMNTKISSIHAKGGGRKKSHPKKCCRSPHGKKSATRACSAFNSFESGTGSSHAQDQAITPLEDRPIRKSLEEQEKAEKCPMPRLYGCSCPDDSETHRRICNKRSLVQCSVCALWFHGVCAGLEPGELQPFREGTDHEKGKYICMQCMVEHLPPAPVDKFRQSANSVRQHQAFDESTRWISSVRTVSELMSDLSIPIAGKLERSNNVDDRSGSGCVWIREPLAEDEISARVSNLEQLREGITNASVGMRERALFG